MKNFNFGVDSTITIFYNNQEKYIKQLKIMTLEEKIPQAMN